jgi:carbamoyltransferase
MDIAASIQRVTEEIVLRSARRVYAETGLKKLCMAGGVALNCVANGRILREGPFEDIWIQPSAGDAGGALGVALFTWYQLLNNRRDATPLDKQQGSLLGPRYSDDDIRKFLDEKGAIYEFVEHEDDLCAKVADILAQNKVIGWVQGRMEFGPRALGCRSILGDARSKDMQSVMNLKIKFRESFRPFAPSVLKERANEFFSMRSQDDSPYMLLVAEVHPAKRVNGDSNRTTAWGIEKLKECRSEVPAITHVDYSARVQTVDPVRHGRFYKLLKRFEEITGCPVVINTSFNVRGEPIVCTPEQAYRCFLSTNIDVLVLEKSILYKNQQPEANKENLQKYLEQFSLD